MVWMNSRAVGRNAYQPTTVEHWANMVSHGVFVIPAYIGAKTLVEVSNTDTEYYASGIYGLALIGLFTVSTVFHIVFYNGHFKNLKNILHRSDRAMIYIFIASSYTPWLFLKPIPIESWSVYLRWGIWVIAFSGIIFQQLLHEKYKMVETIFYVLIGVLPSLSIMEMFMRYYKFSLQEELSGLPELQLGGICYFLGVIFFKMDGRIPLAHAIWHLLVVLAAFIHYFAVLKHLLTHSKEQSVDTLSNGVPLGGICDTQECL